MLRRGFLKRDAKAGWPDIMVCMVQASRSSGVSVAKLVRAAKAARVALAECGRSTWIGAVSGDCSDSRNWLYGRLPRAGDATVVFDACSGTMDSNMDLAGIGIDTLIITKGAQDAGCTIGKQGRAL